MTDSVMSSSFTSILQSNKDEMNKIEAFKNEKITGLPRNVAFTGMVVGGVLLAGLFATQILTGVAAIVALAGAGVGVYYGRKVLIAMDPVIKQKLKNTRLELMVNEARKNAIYQLDNQVLVNQNRLQQARKARDQVGALVESLRSNIKPENKGKPTYEKKVTILKRVEEAYEQIKINIDRGTEANKKFEEKVIDYKDMERFAKTASKAMSLMNTGDHKLEDMLSLESFNQIDTNFNEALISIENNARDMQLDMAA